MSQLSGKVQYLRGLADGLHIENESKEGKLLLALIDAMDEFAQEIARIDAELSELDDVVDNIEEDLETMDEMLFNGEDWDDDDDEDDWDDDDDDEEGGKAVIRELNDGAFIEYECPHCRSKIYYDAKTFDLSQEHTCPDCGKDLFPEENETDE